MAGKKISLLDDAQWPKSGFDFTLPIRPESAALGVVDVQGYVLDVDGHLAHTVRQHSAELQREYDARAEAMIGNIQKLLAAFREGGRKVFYTRHGAQLPDGSDLVLRRRGREAAALEATDDTSGHMPAKGERGYEIDARVAPQEGELVLDKNTSSAFHTTPIDLFLRNLGIDTLVLTGVAADQCVLATAIDAADRGFHVILATDAVANLDPGSAEATQILFGRVWGYVMTTEDILQWLQTGEPPERTRLQD
jgi:nicotinamidase-related amidase